MKEKAKHPKPTIAELAKRVIDTLGKVQGDIEERPQRTKGGFFGPASHFDWSMSAAICDWAVEQSANDLLEALGPRNHFEGPAEITVFLLEEWERLDRELGNLPDDQYDAELWNRQAESLRRTPSSMRFEIALPADASVIEVCGTAIPIGGQHGFTIRAGPPGHVVLSGIVNSPTRQGAIVKTERALDTFLGLARVLDLSQFQQSRDPASTHYMNCSVAGQSARLAALYADRIGGTVLVGPTNLTEISVTTVSDTTLAPAAQSFRLLKNALVVASSRARDVLNACRLAFNVEASIDFGELIVMAFTCLEGLLLQKDSKAEVLGRLSEAVAHSLGGSFEEVEQHREMVKQLYTVRSRFAHTGEASLETPGMRAEVLKLVRRVLRKQVEQLLVRASVENQEL